MKIIAMAGLARTGKDTAGNYLWEGRKYSLLSFAHPIKVMVCALLNCTFEWLETHKDEHLPAIGYSPRTLMQTIGTEWGRQTLHSNFWVDIAEDKLNTFRENNVPGVVITDCRFDNEAEMIRRVGGVVCHIKRDTTEEIPIHASEEGVIYHGSDSIIINNGTLEELYNYIDRTLDMYDTLTRLRR